VLAFARAAADLSALIWPRTELVAARRQAGRWELQTRPCPAANGALPRGAPRAPTTCASRSLVNAAGPWVEQLLRDIVHVAPRHRLRLVKGSHIVVPSLYPGEHAFILQQPDRRVVFAIPFGPGRTLLGTTEVAIAAPAHVAIDAAEIDYLCAAAGRFLHAAPTPRDVLWSYAGVRPLLDDSRASLSSVSRDYALDFQDVEAPLLTAWGGKLTTCRRLAERAVDRLAPLLGATHPSFTATASLPGGALPAGPDATQRCATALLELRLANPAVAPEILSALIDRHGAFAAPLLAGAPAAAGSGLPSLPGLHPAELPWFVEGEWAACADDVLWRRSKAGLLATPAQVAALDTWLANRLARSPA
jgi:glycerol-3-phosphate dehydrogenase